jgi:hypothetical protein
MDRTASPPRAAALLWLFIVMRPWYVVVKHKGDPWN